MRGDTRDRSRPIVVAASIVDEQGRAKYHIIPSRLWLFTIACMGLILVIVVLLLAIMAYDYNHNYGRQPLARPTQSEGQ